MRILVLNWQDLRNPRSGGAEVHLHAVFGRLAARGHDVTLLASGAAGLPPRETVDGMDVHRVSGRHGYTLAARPYFRRHLARTPWDVVVEDLNKVPLYAPLWVRRPLVLLVHHLFGATAFREASAPFAAATWLMERPIPRVYRGVPVQAVSESTAEDLRARGLRTDDLRVIPNGVDTAFFHPDPGEPRFPDPTFLYVGRLKRYKRVDHALAALARVRAGGVPARMIVAGKGDDEPRLRAEAARRGLGAEAVEFAGFVSEARKRALLRRCWANVLPSPKEGWGITNVEAAACGTPSVASDSPGLRESVRAGETGLLHPHGDVGALAAALRRLATDRAEVERLGAGALAFARTLTWDRAADRTEAHLAEVAARGPR